MRVVLCGWQMCEAEGGSVASGDGVHGTDLQVIEKEGDVVCEVGDGTG